MRLRVLGCAGGSAPAAQLSCYLIDDVLAVDAGALTTRLDFDDQRRVHDVLLTHSHLDHVWTLPLFLANRFGGEPVPCRLHGSAHTLETVRSHLFNDQIWPDFTEAVRQSIPVVEFKPIEAGTTRNVNGFEVSCCELVHPVPSLAYRIRAGGGSLIVCGDTHVTPALWDFANSTRDLRGMILECSFPDRHDGLAEVSKHLTPSLLASEMKRLKARVPVYVTHIKPEDHAEVVREIASIGDPRIQILQQDEELDF
jgi:ribonuclease BN (tRNA processing enzyme)